jgi:hypothetical protein
MPISVRTALDAITIFASVGTSQFDVTFTDLGGQQRGFVRGIPSAKLAESIARMLSAKTALRHNVIIRPRAAGIVFHQLDDLDAHDVERVRPVSLLAIETSSHNYQAWIVTRDAGESTNKALQRRLRKAFDSDPAASGATRIPGSLNFKREYAGPEFPRVSIVFSNSNLIATPEQLDALGLLAPEEERRPAPRLCFSLLPEVCGLGPAIRSASMARLRRRKATGGRIARWQTSAGRVAPCAGDGRRPKWKRNFQR